MMTRYLLLAAGLATLGACAHDASDVSGPGASAQLRGTAGEDRGSVVLSQAGNVVEVRISSLGMAPGTYGAHIHMTGRCDAPDFASAGGHWNPAGRQHGRDNPLGAHMGDLPNLSIGSGGSGTLTFVVPGAALRSGASPVLDADGAAIVIHAAADDYRTDPSGNSGARVACGVLG